ncbi:Panacea domain-containing protein [Succinimonas amylolytica]|uniref:Panacea domain-containing protein n=1 Tax=Succinimonas amylolytica TaxID=83769 RepID=UPI0023A82112
MESAEKYSASIIANWFIQRNKLAENEGGDKLSLLKLLKLMYYAEGIFLAYDRGSLFNEPFIAWQHGPVVRSVWKKFTNTPYDLNVTDSEVSELNKISDEDKELLENVFQTFGTYSAWGLRNLTHGEKPWIEATDNGRRMNGEISRDSIRDYFKQNYTE